MGDVIFSPRQNEEENKTSSFCYMSYFVYIIRSLKDSKYYIGSTSNVEARLDYHNSCRQRSTKYRTPFELVLTEEFVSKTEAEDREKQIKSYKGGNAFKKLIHGV